VHGVQTDRGDLECERVLLSAGIWGPTLGAMAGVPIPLVAVQHQLVWTDPVAELAGLQGDTWAQHPIVRHQDLSLYLRQRDDPLQRAPQRRRGKPSHTIDTEEAVD
jgi:glycine/D-amino acid oxidase-like deaminating enzyme